MGKLLEKIVVSCFILLMFIFTACGVIRSNSNQLPEEKPSDFKFVLNYGINAKNQLDTLNGTYTKDMITEAVVTTALKLSDEEMNEIYSEMKKIKILNYPDKFTPKSNMGQNPFNTYTIKITFDGKEKNIYWKDENISNSKEAVQLRDLFKKIHVIVSKKDEYKKLPEPKGGYK